MQIELDGICKAFGSVQANSNISLTVESGTIHGLLGENGAGKTTLMKVLTGYISCDSGSIYLDGRLVKVGSPAVATRLGIGMLHQDPLDVPRLSVLQNFCLGSPGFLRLYRRQSRQKLLDLCQRFGFELDPDELVRNLTMGERQQLELLRLLNMGVRTIILDEPTTGISEPQRVLLFKTLHKLADDGLSIIFVSHKLKEVQELCSEVTVLRQGQVSGRIRAPFTSDALVEMMFGQCLARNQRSQVQFGAPLLRLEDAAIRSYRLDVAPFSLVVRAGEVIGLAGLEGSGQRLFMEACAGIRSLSAGHLVLGNKELSSAPYAAFRRAGVSYVPAARLEEGLIPGMTLCEHFALAYQKQGILVDWESAEVLTRTRIGDYGIVGHPDTCVEELSGGNQQRALLSLLPDELSLLLLEHPTRGLDIDSSARIWARLLERRNQGSAIIFTSTDLDELVDYADRILVFSGGIISEPVSSSEVTCEQLGYMIGGSRA